MGVHEGATLLESCRRDSLWGHNIVVYNNNVSSQAIKQFSEHHRPLGALQRTTVLYSTIHPWRITTTVNIHISRCLAIAFSLNVFKPNVLLRTWLNYVIICKQAKMPFQLLMTNNGKMVSSKIIIVFSAAFAMNFFCIS